MVQYIIVFIFIFFIFYFLFIAPWLEKQECEEEHTKTEHTNIDTTVNVNGVAVKEETEHGLDAEETKQL